MKKRDSMLLKLVVGCLTPLLVAVVAQSLFTISSERQALMEGLSAKAQAVARLMVEVAGPSIAFDDAQAVADGLGYVQGDLDFEYALAVRADGSVIGYRGLPQLQSERALRFTLPDALREAEFSGIVEVSLPVHSNDHRVGAVLVGFKSDRVRAAVSSLVLKAGSISLAGIVAAVLVVLLLARTIASRNRDMRLVLDTVDQAIFTVRPDGLLLEERSQVARSLAQGTWLWDALGAVDPNAGRWLKIGWAELLEDLMPFEVTLEHLPRQLNDGSRTWRVEYKPIRAKSEGAIEKWLVVLSDISSELERQRAESVGSDLLRLLETLSRDRRGVITFIAEANRLVEAIVTGTSGNDLPRDLHTLKGIVAMNGLESLARLVHQLEERLTEGQYDALDRRRLETTWASFEHRLAFVTQGANSVEVTRDDLDELLAKLQAVPGTDLVRARVASLTHEPARLPLERAAAHARVLAKKLAKEEPVIDIDAGSLRLPETFSDFWACFVHVVRNAIDHGLEPADARLAKGKSARGHLALRIRESTQAFVLEVEDDGRGIDFEALASLATRAGLPSQTHADLVNVLFVDGVTTRTSVSEVSGRGIGMGALRRSVEALGGEIEVESEFGAYTRFRFRFPTPSQLALAA